MMKKAELDEALLRMISTYGQTTGFQLSGRALPPWMERWAEDHEIRVVDSPDAPLGNVYLTRIPSDES